MCRAQQYRRFSQCNRLHPPSIAFNDIFWEEAITINKPDLFQKTFEVNVNQENIVVTYSVNISCSIKKDKAPNFNEDTHSFFRMKFESSHSFDDIWKYYIYGYKLFQFCSGRQNVSSEIRLYEYEDSQPIRVIFQDDFDDYAQDVLDSMRVVQLVQLGDKFPCLFKLLNEEKSEPNLLFLPEKNRYWNLIKYSDVTDLCSALDREYAKSKLDHRSKQDKESAKALREGINEFIDALDSYPDYIISKAKALLNQLNSYSPSLKENISIITDLYYDPSKEITQRKGHDLAGIPFFTREQFDRKIVEIKKIRDNSAHAGVFWNEGIDIFSHLKLFVYYSILKRAGYNIEESTMILSGLFSLYF